MTTPREPVIRAGVAAAALAGALLGGAAPAGAAQLLLNGSFESGLTGWTLASQTGSEGGFVAHAGTDSPVNLLPIPAPPAGSTAAVSDAAGPGTRLLFQDFVVPTSAPAPMLTFSLALHNTAPQYYVPTPASLDFSAQPPNQQFRVDILNAASDPYALGGDVLLTLYQTGTADALILGYTTLSYDLSALFGAHVGETLRLRFAHVDNVAPFVVGLDAVSLTTTAVPEPTTLSLLGIALGGRLWRARRRIGRAGRVACAAVATLATTAQAGADTTPLTMLDSSLRVTTVLNAGITQPIGIVFLAHNDFLVLEKASGQMKRVIGGVIQPTPVLDLAVNSASERGLLSAVLHPNFPTTPWVYVRWTESSTGADSTVLADVPLLGNRVDRFVWDGSTLSFDRNIIKLRSRQTDNVLVTGQPAGSVNLGENGNHNGGVMAFGPDGKLFVFMGDQGRRGWMQNLPNGPFLRSPLVDDTFGGPAPDNAHLSGVVVRLNADGTTPADNPFVAAGAAIGGEVGANLQRVYSYGHRNGFGLAFDPYSGSAWLSENADDAFSEVNRLVPGMNGGWIQVMGPLSRYAQFKSIETLQFNGLLQQRRFPPTRLAYTSTLALSRMFMLPGAVYVDPALSWKYEVGPSGMAFISGIGLGARYDGTLWMGSARAFSQVGGNGGSLYRLKPSSTRLDLDLSADSRLADKVADNLVKFGGDESETLVIGRGFGVVPDLKQGPDGHLYVVSLSDNTIYRISEIN